MKSNYKQAKFSLASILCFFILFSAQAQMTVTPAGVAPVTPVNLINQVFLGDGVEVLNVTYTGANAAVGHFSNGMGIVGIEEGILMTTGAASMGNNTSNTSTGFGGGNSGGTDPDLVSISGININDAAIYNITFIPTSDTLRFNYVFASEEYPEFVCSINDVFGFFISGPGLSGPYTNMSTNIALVPGTTTPVGVNTINDGTGFPSPGCITTNGAYYIDNTGNNYPFEFDGFTVLMTATAIVNPCDTYQIKLAIGDASDGLLDSGVFLAANSFSTTGLTVDAQTPNFTSTIGEGCESATVVFQLEEPADTTVILNYTIGGNAIMGVDYVPIPLSGTIPAGQDTFSIEINALADNITEGIDTVILYVNTTPCTFDSFFVYIADAQIVPPIISDTTICFGDTATLDATLPLVVSNGVTFSNTNNISFNHTSVANSAINVSGIPLNTYLVGAIDSVCVNILHTNDADVDIFLRSPSGQFLELSTDNGGTGDHYTNTCFVLDTNAVFINNSSPPFSGAHQPEGDWSDLEGASLNGTWSLTVIDDFQNNSGTLLDWSLHFAPIYNITYDWTPNMNIDCPTCPEVNLYPDTTTQYKIITTDTYGCTAEDSAIITVLNPLDPPVGNCALVYSNSITVEWSPLPSVIGYEINVDNSGWVTLANTVLSYTVNNLMQNQTVQFQIRGTDGNCPDAGIDTVTCTTLTCALDMNIGSVTDVSCFGQANGSALVNLTNAIGSFTYTLNNTTSQTSGLFTGLDTGNYQVTVIDSIACTDTVSFSISQPTALAIDSITFTPLFCNNDASGTATVFASGGIPNYSYQWNTLPMQNGATATGLQAQTYTVTVTDANSCTITDNITLTEPPALGATTSIVNVSCNGLSDGQASAIAFGGTAPYIYEWSTTPIQTTDTAFNLVAGTYTVSITDANNCIFSTSVTISEPNQLFISMASTPATCWYGSDGTGTATVSGGTGAGTYTYLWDTATIAITNPTISTLNVGMHVVTVTDGNGCTIIDSVAVSSPPAIVTTVGENPASCFGIFDGSVSISAVGGTGGFSYSWNTTPVETATFIDSLFSGQYFVTVTDNSGCIAIDTAVIAGPVLLSATKDSIPVTCFGGNNGAASVMATGGTGTYTYTWNNDSNLNTASLTNLTAGTYSVYTADGNGCARIDSMIVETPPMIEANLTMTAVSCNGFTDGTVMTAPSGGTPSYLIDWFDNSNNNSVSNLVAGFYTITITDANNCVQLDTIEVIEPNLLTLVTDTIATSCYGLSDGQAWVTASGGNTSYSYEWQTSPLVLSDTLKNQPTGFYKVIVTDNKNCEDSIIAFIRQPDTLTIDLSQIGVSCFNGSDGIAIADVNGGTPIYTYNWSVPQSNDTISGLPMGNYQLTVSDINSCIATGDIQVTEPTFLALSLSQTPTSCYQGNDGTATASVSGGTPDLQGEYAYEWNTVPAQFDSIAIGLTALQTYTVTVTDANGCIHIDSITIGQPTELLASTNFTPVICNGEANGTATAIPSGGTAPYTFQWNTALPQISSTAINLAAGQYIVTITDGNNCMRTDTIMVSEPDDIVITLDSTNVRCYGLSDGQAWVTVTGGVTPYIYNWNGGTTPNADTLTDVSIGNYAVFINDANSCLDSAFVNITEPDTLTIQFAVDSVNCFGGNDGSIAATVNGGVGVYAYQWSNTALDTSFNNNLSQGVYTLSVTDDNNCITIDSTMVEEPSPISLTLSMRPPTCYNGNDGWATVAATGGNAPYTFSWNTTATTDTIFNLLGGVNYSVTATDFYGCTTTESIFVPNPDTLILTLTTTDEACQSGGNGTATANVIGGFTPYSYIWDTNTGNQTTQTATNLSTGTYAVTITDALGCQASGSGFIGLASGIAATITPTHVLCKGETTGSAIVEATGGSGNFQYVWSANNQTTQTAINLIAGDYSVTVTDNIGCEEIASVTITEPQDYLDITIGEVKDATCYGDQDGYIRISGIGGTPDYSYRLNDGDFGSPNSWSGLVPNNYTLAVKDANGCIFSEIISIYEPPFFEVNLGEDVFISENDTFTANPTITNGVSPLTYLWHPVDSSSMTCFDCPNPTWIGLQNSTYYELLITDSTGCTTEDNILITLEKNQLVYVPTGFSPNGDGVNDILYVQGNPNVKVISFEVFDRWGELVFKSADHGVNDAGFGWDGQFKGRDLNGGVFGWIVEVEFLDGKVLEFRGNVTVVR